MEQTFVLTGPQLMHEFIKNDAYRSPVQLSVVRSEWYEKNGLGCYPGILHEDNLYTVRALVNARRSMYAPVKLYVCRVRDGSIMTVGKSIRNFKGFLKCYLEMNRDIKQLNSRSDCDDLLILKDRMKNAAKVVFEQLSSTEKYKINYINDYDLFQMWADPLFPKPNCWVGKNLVTLIVPSCQEKEQCVQTVWDLSIRYDGCYELSMDSIQSYLESHKGVSSKYIIFASRMPDDKKFVANVIVNLIEELNDNIFGKNNTIDYVAIKNKQYVPRNDNNEVLGATPLELSKDSVNATKNSINNRIEKSEQSIADSPPARLEVLRKLSNEDSTKLPSLCNELISTGDPVLVDEAIQICMANIDNNKLFRKILVKIYSEGVVHEKRFDLVESLLGESEDLDDRLLLIKTYWEMGDEESLAKMYDTICSISEYENPNAAAYLSKLYVKGYPNYNLDEAEKLSRYAMERGVIWASSDLIGILWKKIQNDSESHLVKEMMALINQQVKRNNDNAFAYLGRAYKLGCGVSKDLNKSADCFRHIIYKQIGWDCELFDILMEIGTRASKKEAKLLLKHYKNADDRRIKIRRKKFIFI